MRARALLAITMSAAGVMACGPAPAAPPPAGPAAGGSRVRQPFDPVGYTHTAEGIEAVIADARAREAELAAAGGTAGAVDDATPFAGVIAPHDDYLYAAQVYVHILGHVRARHVVLFGVAHHARDFPETEGKLVFDSFDAWHGPYGDVPISPLRRELFEALPDGDKLVSDEVQAGEHSLEALVPFLQHEVRDVALVPILVPYMSWERLVALAGKTADALAESLRGHGWSLGTDVAIVISSDAVHYGDRDWGGRNHDEFGVNGAAYDQAVARDLALIDQDLVGEIGQPRLEALYRALVQDDFHEYRITWCGRFSIPFGLTVLARTASALGRPVPQGVLLRYGTTLDPGRSDPGVPSLGVTAPANLHHWVGFAALGYR
jgi:AmmeMemoRadiSam system protein B